MNECALLMAGCMVCFGFLMSHLFVGAFLYFGSACESHLTFFFGCFLFIFSVLQELLGLFLSRLKSKYKYIKLKLNLKKKLD